MALGYLAIIGFPFLAGFFSKDPIIEAAFAAGGVKGAVVGGILVLGAGLTAFYMTRMMIMTFFGDARWKTIDAPNGGQYHPHEAPPLMTIPMIVLAVGSVASGWFLAGGERLAGWLTPSVGPYEAPHPEMGVPLVLTLVLGSVAVGVFIAYWFVGRRPVPLVRPEHVNPVVAFARADAGGNWLNETLVARPGLLLGRLSVWADAKGVDGAVNGIAAGLGGLSGRWRRWHNGFVRSYALSMLAGTVGVVIALLLVRFS